MEHLELFTPIEQFDTSKLIEGDNLFCLLTDGFIFYSAELFWENKSFCYWSDELGWQEAYPTHVLDLSKLTTREKATAAIEKCAYNFDDRGNPEGEQYIQPYIDML